MAIYDTISVMDAERMIKEITGKDTRIMWGDYNEESKLLKYEDLDEMLYELDCCACMIRHRRAVHGSTWTKWRHVSDAAEGVQ